MKHKIIFSLFLVFSASLAFSQSPAQPATPPVAVDSVAIARAKIDSLRNALEKTVYPEKQQKAWSECGTHKLDFIAKNRKTDRPFRKADSLLHITKINNIPPSDPGVQELMGQKFVLQQKWEQKYRLSLEGKRCIDLETRRKQQLDSAVAAHPDFPAWKRLIEPANPPR